MRKRWTLPAALKGGVFWMSEARTARPESRTWRKTDRLIGHSSGAVAAMRYAETHRLLGSILVGVCHTDLGDPFEAASGYYEAPWQWSRIRDNQEWIAIYGSSDDPHIPIAEPRFVAAELGCSYFESSDRGHFVDSREFPEIVQLVKRKLKR